MMEKGDFMVSMGARCLGGRTKGGARRVFPALAVLAAVTLAGCSDGSDFYGQGDPPPVARSFSYFEGIAQRASEHVEYQAQPGLELIGAHHAYGWVVTGSGREVIYPEGQVRIGVGGLGLDHNHPKIRANFLLDEHDDPEMVEPSNGYFHTDAELEAWRQQRQLVIRGLTATYLEREQRTSNGDVSVTEGIGGYPAMANVHEDYIVHIDDIDRLYTPLPSTITEEDVDEDALAEEEPEPFVAPVVFAYVGAQCSPADYATASGGGCQVERRTVPNPRYIPVELGGSDDPNINPETFEIDVPHFVDFGEDGARELRVIPGLAQLTDGSQSAGIVGNARDPRLLGRTAPDPDDPAEADEYQRLAEEDPELLAALQNEAGAFHGVAFGAMLVPHVTTANLNVGCDDNGRRSGNDKEFDACIEKIDIRSGVDAGQEDPDTAQLDPDYDKDKWLADYIRSIPGGTSSLTEENAADIFLLDVAWEGNGVVLNNPNTGDVTDPLAGTVNEHDEYVLFLEGDTRGEALQAGVEYTRQLAEFRQIVDEYENAVADAEDNQPLSGDPVNQDVPGPVSPGAFENWPDYVAFRARNPGFDPLTPPDTVGAINDTLVALHDFIYRRGNLISRHNLNFYNHPVVVIRSAHKGFVAAEATAVETLAELAEGPDMRGGPRMLAALPYYYEVGCNEWLEEQKNETEDDVKCRDFRGNLFTAVALSEDKTPEPKEGKPTLTTYYLDRRSPRCGPLPADWYPSAEVIASEELDEDGIDAWVAERHGRHYCVTAPGADTRINGVMDEVANELVLSMGYRELDETSDDYQPDLYAAAYLAGSMALLHERFRGVLTGEEIGRRIMNTADNGRDHAEDGEAPVDAWGKPLTNVFDGYRQSIYDSARGFLAFDFDCTLEAGNGVDPTLVGGGDDACEGLYAEALPDARRRGVYPAEERVERFPNRPSEADVAALQVVLDEYVMDEVDERTNDAIDQEMLETFGAGLIDLDAAMLPVGVLRIPYVVILQVPTNFAVRAASASVDVSEGFSVSASGIYASPAFGDALAVSLAGTELAAFDALGAPFWHDLSGFVATPSGRTTLASRYARLAAGEREPVELGNGGTLSLVARSERTAHPASSDDDVRMDMFLRQPFGEREGGGALLLAAGEMSNLPSDSMLGGAENLADAYLSLVGDGVGVGGAFSLLGGEVSALGFASAGDALGNRETEEDASSVHGGMLGYGFAAGEARIGLQAGALQEERRVLGLRGEGAFAGLGEAVTQFVGARLDAPLLGGWRLDASALGGVTRVDAVAGSLIADWSEMRSSAFSLAFAGSGVMREGDELRVSLAQPLRVESGSFALDVPSGYVADGAPLFTRVEGVGLSPSGRELELGATYRVPISDEATLSLGSGIARDGGHSAHTGMEAFVLGDLRVRF